MSELSRDRIAHELQTVRYGRSLELLAQTRSTNDDARAAVARNVPNGHTVVADTQAAGRGSRGRSWHSPAGSDLYVSIVDRLPIALPELPPLTLAVGLGVADAVDRLLATAAASPSQVKWPNDVWIGGKKCAGVLIETSVGVSGVDALVIGIGLNVNRLEFPEELQASATSLRLSHPLHPELDRCHALCTVLACVEQRVDEFVAAGPLAITRALQPRLALRDRPVMCDGTEGVIRGVDPSGALQLETAHGLRAIVAGRIEPIA